jgi:peptidyl-prolyl cis-trans isomerase B (cyclophilin B)
MRKIKFYSFYTISILCLSTLLAGCDQGDKTESDSAVNSPKVEKAAQKDSSNSIEAEPPEFPLLNPKNHEAFLREYFEANKERELILKTYLGEIKIRLYDETPLHTANFLMMVKRDYFTNTEFTRVVDGFVVQGGNNDKEEEEIKRLLIGNYTIKPEFHEQFIHKRGALAMARVYEENPEKRSSAYNFYLVDGMTFNEPQLLAIERDHEMKIPQWKREVYKTVGGAPHLDNQHTVFGEITQGYDVLDKMAAVETDESDWPLKPLVMEITVAP